MRLKLYYKREYLGIYDIPSFMGLFITPHRVQRPNGEWLQIEDIDDFVGEKIIDVCKGCCLKHG